MLVAQSVVLDVPASEAVIANVPDNSEWPRAYYFRNFHTSPIEIKVQYSSDGGSTWSDINTATIQPNGVSAMWISVSGSMIRISGSGGPGEVYFGVARFFIPAEGQSSGLNLPLFS